MLSAILNATSRASRLFLAPLLLSGAAGAAARPVANAPAQPALAAPDSATTAAPTDTLAAAAPADTARPGPTARARRADYTVAPGVTWHYERPRPFRWLLHIPRDLGQFPGYAFRRESIPTIAGVVASSVLLYVADEPFLLISQDIGRKIGLEATSTQKNLVYIPVRLGSTRIPLEFNVPSNLNSAFYYLGDGWTHLSIATGFFTYGLVKRDNRAAQTATQLGEAILSTGVVVQALKRSTGRQSPFRANTPRGEWQLFPSYSTYQSNVSNYDAFPTGHLATAMATVTVIADNYPEKKFIRPLGYSLMGLLGYSMLNNGVHWVSDYPLGIALGYAFAKIAVRNGRSRVEPAPAGGQGTGWLAPPQRPQPWYRQPRLSPFTAGPWAGLTCTWQLP